MGRAFIPRMANTKKKKQKTGAAATAKGPSKTAFVLSLPRDMPAKQVIEKAKAAGISIKEGYVSNIRSAARTKRKKAGARGASKGVAATALATKAARGPSCWARAPAAYAALPACQKN